MIAVTEKPNPGETIIKWQRYILALARRFASRHEDREELANEIVVAVLKNWSRWNPARGAFSTWATQVARTTANAQRSHRDRHTVRATTSLNTPNRARDERESFGDHLADCKATDPTEEADRRIRQQIVARAIAKLPHDEQEAIQARYYEGVTTITSTTREAMNRGLASLAGELEHINDR